MSTVDRPGQRVLPPLVAGQRLDQPTFHERYEAMPPGHAGRAGRRSCLHAVAAGCRTRRDATATSPTGSAITSGSPRASEAAPTRRPDSGRLRRAPAGLPAPHPRGAGRPDPRRGRIHHRRPGAGRRGLHDPAGTTTSGPRRRITSGPVSWNTSSSGSTPIEVHWFVRRDGRFVELLPGPDGIYRSEVFPGLWLEPRGLLRRRPGRPDRGPGAGPGHARACGVRRAAGPGRRCGLISDPTTAATAPGRGGRRARAQGRVVDGVRDPEVGVAAAEDVAGDDQQVVADRLGDEFGRRAPGARGKA